MIKIENAKIVTPNIVIENGTLATLNGKITHIDTLPSTYDNSNVTTIDAHGLTLIPGFIDVHTHGAVGVDTMDASSQVLQKLAEFYAQHGVTSFLATTWTDSRERINNALQAVKDYPHKETSGANLLGVHLEGPYLNPEKCGAQNVNYVRQAQREEAIEFLDYGVIRLLSVAPEFSENHWLITECVERGITISVAHSNSTYEDIIHAQKLGLSHATHTYNAMPPLHHRKPGTLGAVMTMPEIRCEIIADNIHVHPVMMNLLWRTKGKNGVILVSDSMSATAMPEGEYQVDERMVIVKNGEVRLESGSLAGSILTMEVALKNFMQATHEPLENIWQTSSLNAAKSLGIDSQKGSIEVGKDADFILMDNDLQVHLTVVDGEIVYQR